MRRFTRKFAMLATALVVLILVSACGGSGGDGPTGIKPPPTPTVVSAAVVGTTSMVAGDSAASPRVELTMSNGTKQDAPSSAVVLSSTAPSVIVVTTTMMKAVAPGSAQITASYPGFTVTPLSVTVTPRPVTVVSISVVGDSTTEMPDVKQYRLVRKYSDGSSQDLVAVWSYPSPDWMAGYVNPTGLLTPHALGTIRVQATYQGVIYTLSVRVVGTPRKNLPVISDAGWAWMWDHTRITGGFEGIIGRLSAGQKKVFVGVGFSTVKAMSASTRASTLLKGALTFVQVADSASASIFFTTNPRTKIFGERCAGGEGIFTPEAMAIGGVVMVDPSSSCINDEDLILHELLHALGFGGHVNEPGIMSAQGITPGFGPLFTEIAQWFYDPRVKYGSIPIP